MVTLRALLIALAAASLFTSTTVGDARRTVTDEDSVIFKTSIQVSTTTVRSVKGADGMWYDNFWHWAPRIKFNVQGPLPSGSQIATEFFLPGNKSWVKYDCRTPDVPEGKIGNIECGFGLSDRELKGIKEIGDFNFKIYLKNELAGTNATVFSGRFNIKKFRPEPDLPVNQNHWVYYVDHDWALPLAFVWYPRPFQHADGVIDYDGYATLLTAVWFKGTSINAQAAYAYVFYQGKEVSNTKAHGLSVGEISLPADGSNRSYDYSRVHFEFLDVFGFANDHRAHPGYYLNEHPGEYEVKILRGGKLARALKFTIGSDGKLQDNGLAAGNNILGYREVVPAQVLGDTDGARDGDAWKTGMLYGNPLSGFVAP